MCVSEGRREGEETVLGGKGSFREAALETAKNDVRRECCRHSFQPASSSPPPPLSFLLLGNKIAFFPPSRLLSYSWHGQFPFAKKIFRLIKEITKSDE